MSAQSEGSGRDYIVEYRAGQFQNGSLVLRFGSDPTEKQLREALLAYGLPARALEEVRARPLHSARPRPAAHPPSRLSASASASTPPPATGTAAPSLRRKKSSGCGGGQVLLFLALTISFFLGLLAQDAQQAGGAAGTARTSETMVVGCWDDLTAARSSADPDLGVIGGFLAQEPTVFAFTPANTAFYVSCLSAASAE